MPRSSDLEACRQMLRHGSRSFHAAARLLPTRVSDPAMALYAFCRLADDAVDGQGGDGQGGDGQSVDDQGDHAGRARGPAVERLRERLARAYDGRPASHPADRALAEVVARFAMPRALPEALLEGLAWDAEGRRYEDLSGLLAYAARVAGAVGAMMAVVMGARDAVARACDLGVAMQLTNIARDVGEDARNGRVYLPRLWLREVGIDADEFVASPRASDALAEVVSRLLTVADTLYARGESGISRLPLSCRPGIMAARLLYAEIGRQVERNGHDSVAQRAVVPSGRKATLLAQAMLRTAVSSPPGGSVAALPPLAETRFLIQAVQSDVPMRETVAAGVRGRAEWVLDLFEQLQRRDALARARV